MIMTLYSAFSEKHSLGFNYLMAPFTIYTQINMNKSYNPTNDPYKY